MHLGYFYGIGLTVLTHLGVNVILGIGTEIAKITINSAFLRRAVLPVLPQMIL